MSDNVVAIPTFINTAEELAKECRSTLEAFLKQGFTPDQAFRLLLWVLNE